MPVKPLDSQFSDKQKPTILPKIPFSSYIVASKKSGKTTLLLNLLLEPEYLKGKFNKIFWISPTGALDDKTQILKETEGLLKPNKKLIKAMKKKLEEKEIMSDDLMLEYQELKERPDRLTDSDYLEELDIDYLEEILNNQKKIISTFSKDVADDVLLVLDDSIESKIIKHRRFKNFLFKSRHYKISVFFISQSYFSLPKALRLNNSQVILFETGNRKELQEIYSENNNGLSWKEFYEAYRSAVDVPFNFLNINYDNTKKFRLLDGLDEFLVFD
jgi:hypothetical protein